MGSPLRILHVVVNMNHGGAETLIMNLYRSMDRTKVQFDFLTCKRGVFDTEIVELGGRVHRIPYITDVGHFKYIKELNKFFNQNKHYKIVHSHMDKMSGFVLREAKKAGIPIRISHSHSTNSEGKLPAIFYKWYAGKQIFSNATNLLACSNEAAKWLFLSKSKQVQVLKNGIDGEKFKYSLKVRNKVRASLNIKNDTFVIGHVGRFSTPKNHLYLIDIFKEMINIRPNSLLILVGDGPLFSEIKKKVIEYNLTEKVNFLGVRNDVNQLLQAFDLFVFPSLYEGLPVSLIEAQASSLPCVISDTISSEVDLGLNLVEYISLTDKKKWIEKILYKKPETRNDTIQALFEYGYDIKQSSKQLEDFYCVVSR